MRTWCGGTRPINLLLADSASRVYRGPFSCRGLSRSTTHSVTTTSCSIRIAWPEPARRQRQSASCATGTRASARTACCGGRRAATRSALRLFNPDGSEFEKSGNGLRIFAALPVGPGAARAPRLRHSAHHGDPSRPTSSTSRPTRIAMDMGRATFDAQRGRAGYRSQTRWSNRSEVAGLGTVTATAVRIGNPHAWSHSRSTAGTRRCGSADRPGADARPGAGALPLYPQRTNVQFARVPTVTRSRSPFGSGAQATRSPPARRAARPRPRRSGPGAARAP